MDVQQICRLFIISTARDLDLDEFFKYEYAAFPPSISINGGMRQCNKSQLMLLLEKKVNRQPDMNPPVPNCECVVFDGALLAHTVKPTATTKLFTEYASLFRLHIQRLLASVSARRADVVWDLYSNCSLKAQVRGDRGAAARRQDLPTKGVVPTGCWDDYLRNDNNKEELFQYLAEDLLKNFSFGQVTTNVNETIFSSHPEHSSLHKVSIQGLEEADGRILLHVRDAVQKGARNVLIRSSDTDVAVLAVSFYHTLKESGLEELWMLFGAKEHKRYVSIHDIAENLGFRKAKALRGFHAFTGCDSVSSFASKGKRSCWSAWKTEDTTQVFEELGDPETSSEIPEKIVTSLETYLITLYGVKDQQCCDINSARKILFTTEYKHVAAIPPTRDALVQHIKRASYQAGQVWGRALEKNPPPSPGSWGWAKVDQTSWKPVWTLQPEVWAALRSLDRCGCKTGCLTARCKCKRFTIPCTPACKVCKGKCKNCSSRLTTVIEVDETEEDVDGDLFDDIFENS